MSRTLAGVPFGRRAVMGLVVVLVVTVVLVWESRRDPDGPRSAVAQATAQLDGASARSREGAVGAAAGYATLLARSLPAGADRARRVAAEAASDAYRPALLAAVDRDLVPVQRRAGSLPGRTLYRQAVLATRADRVDERGGRARVAVWLLSMLGQTGQPANPLASFTTVRLDLVWERSGWRLDGVSETAGPTPLLDGAPQPVDEVAAALEGFSDWRPA
ncbi:MAG TPA: hypothetical protein VEL73_02050 [Mycobacteriales bacterium]|nr:hypothetical protein [Mycobacteriales bacterium]